MSEHQRDFYRIQDRLLMAWRHADIEPASETTLSVWNGTGNRICANNA